MVDIARQPVKCPKCKSTNVTLVVRSSLAASLNLQSETIMVSYKCECGVGFTRSEPICPPERS